MDDLDKIVLEVALSILRAEAKAPGSQAPSSVSLAEEIATHLQQRENQQLEGRRAAGE